MGVGNIRVEIDGRDYTWCGGFGCILKSWERGVKQGDVRMISEELFYAYMVQGREISWTVANCKIEGIRFFKDKLFGRA